MTVESMDTKAIKYELEIEIQAPRKVVWSALTEEINAWWLAGFRMVGDGSVLTLDARAGGQLVESREGGGSLLWYTVQMCLPEESLHLVGFIAPEWGGPATTMLELSLEDLRGGTLLRVKDALFGVVSKKNAFSLRDGWGQLFGEGLKRHVE